MLRQQHILYAILSFGTIPFQETTAQLCDGGSITLPDLTLPTPTIEGANRTQEVALIFGDEHNIALEEVHQTIEDASPVDMDDYLLIVKSQARSICAGNGECLASVDDYTNRAINYAVQDRSISSSSSNQNSSNNTNNNHHGRRLSDILPDHRFGDYAADAIDRILLSVSFDNEETILQLLEDLHLDIFQNEENVQQLKEDEKFAIEAAISVAKASTSYWHKAYRDESNHFRRLSSRVTVFDCLMTGDSHYFRDDDDVKHLQDGQYPSHYHSTYDYPSGSSRDNSNSRRRKLRGKHNQPISSKLPSNISSLQTKKRELKSYKSYDNGQHFHNVYHEHDNYNYYQQSSNNNNNHGSNEFHDDDDWYKRSVDKFSEEGRDGDTDDSSSDGSSSSSDGSEDSVGFFKRVTRFFVNIGLVIRADIIGVLVGATIGRGCWVPSVSSSFLFSAIYAICYRRGLDPDN